MVIPEHWEECFSKLKQLRPICANMSDREIRKLMDVGEFAVIQPQETISSPSLPSLAVYIILTGSVLVSRTPTWGDHAIYFARRTIGTFVGEVTGRSLLREFSDPFSDSHFIFTGTTRAETECEMLMIKHEDFEGLVKGGGQFALNVFRCMAIKVLDASKRMEFLKHQSAVSRIADELLNMAEQQNKLNELEIPMRMKEFAWWLDLEAPTLSKALRDMDREGWISYHTRRPSSDEKADDKPKGKARTITINNEKMLLFLRKNDRKR